MEISIFPDKDHKPAICDLKASLGTCYLLWAAIRDCVFEKYPAAIEDWSYPGKKYGWSFRIKDKKRTIVYLLPRDNYFKVAMVFGQKATDLVLGSNISDEIKDELKNARVYAEGRGIRIDVKNKAVLPDIKKLVEIKIAH
jgi:hypothetical protein